MIDLDLIQQCADPRHDVAAVQHIAEEMNVADHLSVQMFPGEKMGLLQPQKSSERAAEVTMYWIDKANVQSDTIFGWHQHSRGTIGRQTKSARVIPYPLRRQVNL